MIELKHILAILAYIVFNFLFAIIWNLGIFKKSYKKLTRGIARHDPIFSLGILAILIQGVALVILFTLFSKGTHPILEGITLSLLVGSYSIVYGAFVVPAKFMIKPVSHYAVLELIYGIIHFAVAGIIIALIIS